MTIRLTVAVAIAIVLAVPATVAASGSSEPRLTTSPASSGLDGAAATRTLSLGAARLPNRSLDRFTSYLDTYGVAPATWTVWLGWGDGGNSIFTPSEPVFAAMRRAGTIPLIFWMPIESRHPNNGRFSFPRIARGDHDAYIKRFARRVAAYGRPVFIRFAHEFDASWPAWSVSRNGNSRSSFIRAWRHVWKIFRGKGGLAKNARFVWSPLGIGGADRMRSLFPGASYVEWIGMTTYNWGSFRDMAPMNLGTKLTRRMRLFSKLPKSIPIMIAEFGSDHIATDKAQWLRNATGAVYSRFPRIRYMSYVDVDVGDVKNGGQPGRKEDWRLVLPSDGSAVDAWRSLVTRYDH
jgi:hypothetical protein